MKAIASSSSVERHAERLLALEAATHGQTALTELEADVLFADLVYIIGWRCSCRFEGKNCTCLDRLSRERLTFISERAAVSFDAVLTAMLNMDKKAALLDWRNLPPFAPALYAEAYVSRHVQEGQRRRRGPYRRR